MPVSPRDKWMVSDSIVDMLSELVEEYEDVNYPFHRETDANCTSVMHVASNFLVETA